MLCARAAFLHWSHGLDTGGFRPSGLRNSGRWPPRPSLQRGSPNVRISCHPCLLWEGFWGEISFAWVCHRSERQPGLARFQGAWVRHRQVTGVAGIPCSSRFPIEDICTSTHMLRGSMSCFLPSSPGTCKCVASEDGSFYPSWMPHGSLRGTGQPRILLLRVACLKRRGL